MKMFSFTREELGLMDGKLLAVCFMPEIGYLSAIFPFGIPRKREYRKIDSDNIFKGWTITEVLVRFLFGKSALRLTADWSYSLRSLGASKKEGWS